MHSDMTDIYKMENLKWKTYKTCNNHIEEKSSYWDYML